MFLFPSSATDLQFNYSSSDRSDTMTSSSTTTPMNTKKKNLKDLLTSKDWMGTYQENHVDIDLKNSNPFSSSAASSHATTSSNNAVPLKGGGEAKEEPVPALKHQDNGSVAKSSSSTTDWMGEYYQSLGAGSSAASATASLKKSFALPRSRQTSLNTKPLSRSSSKQSAGGNKPNMDSFKMSVDMSAFLTPSMDAAMEQIQQEEERLEQQQQDDDEASGVVSGLTTRRPNGSTYASKDAAMMLLSKDGDSTTPLPMDTDDNNNAAVVDVAKIVALTEQSKAEQLHKVATRPKKKKKKPRRNKEPDVKVYVEPNDTDVLLGRGGRSNHHVGNVAYRTEVGNLRDWYRSSEKNAKTDLSQLLVDWVHKEQQGRFLKLDTAVQRWYIVTNIVARRKASQALREHMTREERALKKQQQQGGGGGT